MDATAHTEPKEGGFSGGKGGGGKWSLGWAGHGVVALTRRNTPKG